MLTKTKYISKKGVRWKKEIKYSVGPFGNLFRVTVRICPHGYMHPQDVLSWNNPKIPKCGCIVSKIEKYY